MVIFTLMRKETEGNGLTEEQVWAEIEEARKSDPELLYFLNNFMLNLPGMLHRNLYEEAGIMDTQIGSYLQGLDTSHSPLYLSKTYREFFSDYDKAMVDTGVNFETLIPLIKEKKIAHWEVNAIILPGYVNMRMQGYSHYPDLTV
jgi:hypothetical protein